MPSHLQTISLLFDHFNAGDVPGALALMTNDATWRVPGKPDLFRAAGAKDRTTTGQMFQRMIDAMGNSYRMTLGSSIAQGDRVAVEATGHGDLKNGRRYRQEYHFVFEFRDAKICAVREYLDTQHAHDVWFRQ